MSNTKKKKTPVSQDFICQFTRILKTLESKISEAYKVQAGRLKDSESDSYEKTNVNEKVEWLRQVALGNARKIENSIIFRKNPDSYFATY